MSSADPLLARADALYALPPSEFTAARDAAAKDCGNKELGARIRALRKPSVAAWAVNLLVRREVDQIDQVLSLGAALRDAAGAMAGDDLRALTRQRRQLTAVLTTSARSLAREYDVRLTPTVGDQVEAVLNAAMLDSVAADVVRSGLLVTAFVSTGVGDLDVDSVVAVPSAVGVRARAIDAPRLHVVPDDTSARRERARTALEAATTAESAARRDLAAADRELERARTRRGQAQEEIARLQSRLTELSSAMDGLESDLATVTGTREDRAAQLAAAEEARAQAAAEVETLSD